jgi:hypothetical protein
MTRGFHTSSRGVAVAILAAIGIGALRPLGRYSLLLLLPFAPWLFVGSSPLVAPAFISLADRGHVFSFLALVPASWVSIPALFIATLLCHGQAARLRASGAQGGAVVRAFVVPVLPLAVLLFGAVWLWQSQDLLWQEIMSNLHSNPTAPIATVQSPHLYDVRSPLGLVLPAVMLGVFVVVAIAAQLGYLDKVAIRVGGGLSGSELVPRDGVVDVGQGLHEAGVDRDRDVVHLADRGDAAGVGDEGGRE